MEELKPVILCLSERGLPTARRLAARLDGPVHGLAGRVDADVAFTDAMGHARDLFLASRPIVGVCAAGILIRALAPCLADKTTEPPVIAVAEDGSAVVPLLGGHHGANRLARDCAQVLGVAAAVTTAGDLAFGLALDEPPPGWRLVSPPAAARAAMASLLAGGGARVEGNEAARAGWLAGLPQGDAVSISTTMEPVEWRGGSHIVFHPLRATLGVGCARNCPPGELAALVRGMLADAGLAPAAIAAIGTLDLKADEPAVLELSRALDLPLRLFDAGELEAETPRLATPSDTVFAEVGCHGVAEAAALALGGPLSGLWYEKRKSANATCALAIRAEPVTRLAGCPRGKLSIIGIGPGKADWRSPEASALVGGAEELVGYGLYLDLLGPLAAGRKRTEFPLGGEEDRCRHALESAGAGTRVALICSGDAGIYAMAALVWELIARGDGPGGVSAAARRAEIVTAPGISAMQAAAARAGAPLGHDFCAISLSDLLTPRATILQRLHAAAEGDFVTAFYNPVSSKRRDLLDAARDILLQHRPADTPVAICSSLGRPEESCRFRRLADLQTEDADMLTILIIGATTSRMVETGDGPRMFTPRGYETKRETAG